MHKEEHSLHVGGQATLVIFGGTSHLRSLCACGHDSKLMFTTSSTQVFSTSSYCAITRRRTSVPSTQYSQPSTQGT